MTNRFKHPVLILWEIRYMNTNFTQLCLNLIQYFVIENFQAKEREVQRKQLEDIFKLMDQNNDKFGINSFDDIQDQMTLYAQ